MRVAAFLYLVTATTVSSLHLCEPFSQAKHGRLTLSFIEAEKTRSGVNFTFFVEKEGIDSANERGMANLGPFYEEVQGLPLKAHVYNGNKLVDCRISTPGWEDWRFYAKADCPIDVDNDPKLLTLVLQEDAVVLGLCTDPPKSSRSTPSLAVCVRSFSSTVFGTEDIAVTPGHVIRWLDHHIKLGIDRFYLYERTKGELSSFLSPYMDLVNSIARERVEITYVPRLSQQNKTFDKLDTKSYVFDQIMTMQSCFSKARTQNFDYVFHIDYDEYIHPQAEVSIHEAVHHDIASCSVPNGLSVLRCNILDTKFDVPVVPHDAECFPNDSNVKTAFNATFMAGDVFHSIHVVQPRCDSNSILIHHLPDAYADRSRSPRYLRNLWGLDDIYGKAKAIEKSKGKGVKKKNGRSKGKNGAKGKGKDKGKGRKKKEKKRKGEDSDKGEGKNKGKGRNKTDATGKGQQRGKTIKSDKEDANPVTSGKGVGNNLFLRNKGFRRKKARGRTNSKDDNSEGKDIFPAKNRRKATTLIKTNANGRSNSGRRNFFDRDHSKESPNHL